MFYQAYELGRIAAAPLRVAAGVQGMWLRHPLNPLAYTPAGHNMATACDVVQNLTGPWRKPAFGLDRTVCDGQEIPVREADVRTRPFGQLKHFMRAQQQREDPRLLLVAPLAGHFATLLRDTVRTLLPAHDVYVTDWFDARLVPQAAGRFGLDDCIDYIIDFLDFLGAGTHVVAVCQATVPVLAAAAIMAEDDNPAVPRSLAFMGGPIDARINPTIPSRLATAHDLDWFRRHMIATVPTPYPGAGRRVHPGFVRRCLGLNPVRFAALCWDAWQPAMAGDGAAVRRQARFFDEYFALMDLPATFFLQTMQRVFQQFQLPRGRFTWHGRPIEPAAIRDTALLTIEAGDDDVCGPGQTAAAHQLCSSVARSRRQHHLQHGANHYDLFNGPCWRHEIAPRLQDFIRESQ